MSSYFPYKYINNLSSTLQTAISSSATTVQLNSGEGERRGNEFPMIATIENFDSTGKVAKREIVIITARNGDVLTIQRKAFQCFPTDDDNSLAYKSRSFDSGDTISNYIAKEYFDEINIATNDLYDNGVKKLRTDVVSGLQVHVNGGPVLVGSSYYDFEGGNLTLTDNATNYVEIDQNGLLTANTTDRNDKSTKIAKVITSGGEITSIEDWRLGTVGGEIGGVNIHDLTEKTSLNAEDELIISDSENIRQNKKTKLKYLSGHQQIICGENIQKGDVVAIENYMTSKNYNLGTNGTTTLIAINNNEKYAQMVYGSGTRSKNLYFVGRLTSTSSTTLTIRIETDNNGEPSGTLVDANATHTLLTTEATTTEGLIAIQFPDYITLEKGVKYRVVFSGGSGSNFEISYEVHNHTQGKVYTTSYNDFADYDYYEITATMGGGATKSHSQDYDLTPTSDVFLYSFYGNGISEITISENGNTLFTSSSVSGAKFAPNILLQAGHTYHINFYANSVLFTFSDRGYNITGPFTISNVSTFANGSYQLKAYNLGFFGYRATTQKSLLVKSVLFANYLKKVDIKYTYKELGIANDNYSEGEYGDITTKGANIPFSSLNYIPGERYKWNGTAIVIDSGPRFEGNNVIVGLAIDNHLFSLELEQIYYNTTQKVLAIAKNGVAMVKNGGFNRNGEGFSQAGRLVLVYDGDNMNIQETEIVLK